jgi:HPt (histidine-containing phosphotransfer) domain-containing protein
MTAENKRFIDPELLRNNCAGDLSMMRDLINMGILSVNSSLTDAKSSMENEDWDRLARVLHKLRPVLCYCGINSLTDELLVLEENAKQGKELRELSVKTAAMLDTLQQVHDEMEHHLSSISAQRPGTA